LIFLDINVEAIVSKAKDRLQFLTYGEADHFSINLSSLLTKCV